MRASLSSTLKRPSRVAVAATGAARIQRVQLTYDDGPDSAGNTRAVLDALNAAGAKATFYLVGKRVAQGDNWRLVFDLAAAGHWLGNHAFDWDDEKDEHIFLEGPAEERAEKILRTEWAIRDALILGRTEAKQKGTWEAIPEAHRAAIEDLIASGTGRFRTPGFKSKPWKADQITTLAAISAANDVLSAAGLRALATTDMTSWGLSREGVTVDPKDWKKGRTKEQIESAAKGGVQGNADSILLHSRVKATAEATPAIAADLKGRKMSFDPTVRGETGAGLPKPPFAGLSKISDPPAPSEIATARAFLWGQVPSIGPVLAGNVAIGIFKLAQRAGPAEVAAFEAELRSKSVQTETGLVSAATWMCANDRWALFALFYENWKGNRPFPREKTAKK